ncbi:hypothetical protein EHR03_13065 [Leptospira mayottensis]|uniref:Uncharacterized protein n=1 Tax=Leptospira mayottensis 200901116 TaxID=1192864 RepID=A0A343US07_9LEPT|nr:hypothetical protein [Leptospira mayottensis]AVH81580.1 hypothetical protein [Leptospira mayottensis 200901116]TGN00354.1 hypothetical protein EHR03_13065 [Leptospira mayottensis]
MPNPNNDELEKDNVVQFKELGKRRINMNIYQISSREEGPYYNNKLCELVFAKNELRAKRLYWRYYKRHWYYHENDAMIYLKQLPQDSSMKIFEILGDLPKCGGFIDPDIEELAPILRELGWMYDDESGCDTCGLYPFGMEEHWIDEDGKCDECRDPIIVSGKSQENNERN